MVKFEGVKNPNDYEELVKMFFPDRSDVVEENEIFQIPGELLDPEEKKDEIKKSLYQNLSRLTGKKLKWGTLTGVKPLKLYNNLLSKYDGDKTNVRRALSYDYLVSDEKISLLEEINGIQRQILEAPGSDEVVIYIGIPFCPTRCTYCSFTSNQKDYNEISRYMEALYREIDYVSIEMRKRGLCAETVYIGGGTPTTLNVDDLTKLINTINERIPVKTNFEFTVEAGRPDTITEEKLITLRNNGVNRISINPQTMNGESLKIIGRDHSIDDIKKAFETVKDMDFKAINSDLIAGLPGESESDFKNTLDEITKYEPENVTVHTLALKKSSKMMEDVIMNTNNASESEERVADVMVGYGERFLKKRGYRPYYIYRQKYMADNLENVGYAKAGTECIYNIRIMEEKQTVIAMGAGGSSKIYFPEVDRLERVINVSNYEIYIERIDEMIDRKKKNIFITQSK